MSEVRGVVTLHSKTVQKGEKLAKERRSRSRRAPEPEPEVTQRYAKCPPWMNRAVWKEALRLSDNHPKRIVLISPTEALVLNK